MISIPVRTVHFQEFVYVSVFSSMYDVTKCEHFATTYMN